MRSKGSLLIFSWALYDLANQFFALNMVSFYFPRWLTVVKQAPEIFYSLAFGTSMVFVALLAPILGSIADIKRTHRTFLVYFTFISVIFTMGLGWAPHILVALVFFAIANVGCQVAVVFYNALMVKVASRERIGLVSGLGRMFGYSGAILALVLTKPVILNMGYQPTFFLTGLLFLIFSLPCLIFVKDNGPRGSEAAGHIFKKDVVLQTVKKLKTTILDRHKFAELKNFLKAAFFGLCVVNTIILFMSVYATKMFGLTEIQVMHLIAFSTIFAILGSISSGLISDKIGYKKSLVGVFVLWGICLTIATFCGSPLRWLVGAVAGVSLGATWVISRALVIRIVPKEQIGEAFGLFSLVSYISAIVGPLYLGLILLYLSRFGEWGYRLAYFSLNIFIVIALLFLLRVKVKSRA